MIKEYGVNNVTVTGHSLGGSQALYVSRKNKVHAEVYNPHISWNDALTHNNYFHANIHVNKTDPVAALYPWITAHQIDSRYNKNAKPFLGQHGIDNFIKPVKSIPKKTPTAVPVAEHFNSASSVVHAHPFLQVVSKPKIHNENECSRMPLEYQLAHGCPQAFAKSQGHQLRAYY